LLRSEGAPPGKVLREAVVFDFSRHILARRLRKKFIATACEICDESPRGGVSKSVIAAKASGLLWRASLAFLNASQSLAHQRCDGKCNQCSCRAENGTSRRL
jgi:hypothetical protein